MFRRFWFQCLISISFLSDAFSMKLAIEENVENPFSSLVRILPCEILVKSFTKFCEGQLKETKDFSWQEAKEYPLDTLKGYVKEHLRGRKKLVVACTHSPQSGVSSSSSGVILSREGENHRHADAVTLISHYEEYKDGKFWTFPPSQEEEKALIVENGKHHYVEKAFISDFRQLNVDFIRNYPFIIGSEDFPENYFEEIYVERGCFE